jgi:hypothetical protein
MVTYYLAKDLSCFDVMPFSSDRDHINGRSAYVRTIGPGTVRIALHFFFSKLLNQGSVRVRYSSRFPVPGGLGLTEAACS